MHQALALLEELAFGTEVFLLQLCGFLFFAHDGLLALLFLLGAEEYDFTLIGFVQVLGFLAEGFHFCLPFAGHLIELFIGALVGGNVLKNIFHVDEHKLLCFRLLAHPQREGSKEKDKNLFHIVRV